MGVTSIRIMDNQTDDLETFYNRESNRTHYTSPGTYPVMDEWLPWCSRGWDFDERHTVLRVEAARRTYWIWQHYQPYSDDRIRFATDGR